MGIQEQKVFLISTGRTGTSFFAKFFSDYVSDVIAYHTSSRTHLINIISNLYILNKIDNNIASLLFQKLKYNHIVSDSKTRVECNPYYLGIIDILNSTFPNSKFIFIVRDPETYVTSCIRFERQRIKSKIANYLIPYWRPVPYIEELKGVFYSVDQRINYYASDWEVRNRHAHDTLASMNNVFTVLFHDIFDTVKGPVLLKKMVDWIELPLKPYFNDDILYKKHNMSRGSSIVLTDPQKETISAICDNLWSDLRNKYKYQ